MGTVLWRGLRTHARRMVATFLAVMCAVAFVAGTFIFSDTASAGFYDTYARFARNVDVSVQPKGGGSLSPAEIDTVRSTSGVSEVDARMQATLPLIGRDGRVLTNFGRPGIAISAGAPAKLRPYDLTGAAPGPGQVLIDKETLEHQHWRIGEAVTVLDRAGRRHTLRISGVIDFGVFKQYAGQSVVGLPPSDLTALTGDRDYLEVVASAAPGVSATALTARVRAALRSNAGNLHIVDGATRRSELANEAVSVASQFQFILLVFGVIALIVAAFVIYNTFAILLAQRVRETALLRCVGATRRQVFTMAVGEASAIGLIAGAAGVGLGAGVAYGLIKLLNAVAHAGIPAHAVTVSTGSVIVGLLVGLVVTVLASLMPAVRATRVTAMSAMRDNPVARTSRARSIVRVVLALALLAGGAAVTYRGTAMTDAKVGTFTVVAGGVVAFLGLLVAAPIYVGPLLAALGLAARPAGTPARIAVANSRRNPGRTALTTATLMIGIALMALLSVTLSSVRQTAADQIGSHYPIDYLMSPIDTGSDLDSSIPASYAASLRSAPEFAAVGEVRAAHADIGGRRSVVEAIDPGALGGLASPKMSSGRLADLNAGTVVLSSAWRDRPRDGSVIVMRVGDRTARLRVVGAGQIGVPEGESADALVSWDRFAQLVPQTGDAAVLVKAAPGVGPVASRDRIDAMSASYPLVSISSVADLRSELDSTVNGLLALFAGLLGTAVLISLFGIANTLALSVQERTRESATLRALGLTRGQLRGALLFEALLMGLAGAIVGIAFGLVYGRLVVKTAFVSIGPTVSVPWSWIGGLLVLAGVAATTAALLPARRAARSAPVAAMADA